MARLGPTGLTQLLNNIKAWVLTKIPTKTSDLTNDSHQTITKSNDTTSTALPAHSGTFTCIDTVTRDSNGHVTAVNTKTVTLPADNNTDTKVTNTLGTTTKAYVTGTTSATTNTGTQIFDTGVYLSTTAGELVATKFTGTLNGNASSATQFSANKSVTLTGDVTGTASSKAGWSVATTLSDSGVTAGTYGPSADVTGNNNATISVPEITVDAKGRVTSVTNRTLTCKNNTYSVYNKTLTIQKNGTNVATFTSNSNTDVTANITVPTKTSDLTNDSHQTITVSTDTTSTASPAHSGTFTCIDSVTRDSNGHVTKVNTKTITLPSDNNTDTKVTQTASNSNAYYPVLVANTNIANTGTLPTTSTEGVRKSYSLSVNTRYGFLYGRNQYDTDNLKGAVAGGNRTSAAMYSLTYDNAVVGAVELGRVDKYGNRYSRLYASNYITDGALATDGTAISSVLDIGVLSNGLQYISTSGGWNCNVFPCTSNTRSLGTSDLKWSNVYATTFTGNLTGNVTGNVTGNCSGSSGSCTGNAATATKATGNANGKELTNTIIKGLSISGKTITYTQIDGTTGTLTTQDTNTDTLMTQNVSTTNNKYPILLCPTAEATANQGAKTGIFGANALINPSTGEIISKSNGTGAFRVVGGNYGFFIRNDGSNTYFMLTASGDQYGTWTSARPLTISNSTGVCSINGNAATATKLATARNIALGNEFIGSANFDGSGNITINGSAYLSVVSIGNKNNYPYHCFAKFGPITTTYQDAAIKLLVSRQYIDGGTGIIELEFRTNATNGDGQCSIRWIVRSSKIPVDCIQVGFYRTWGGIYADVFYKSSGAYDSCVIRSMGDGSRASYERRFTLQDSNEANNTTTSDPLTSVNSYASIAAAGTALHNQAYTDTITATDEGVAGTANACSGNSATASKVVATVANDNTGALVQGTMGTNDCFRIAIGGASNAGWAEIATGDDYNEPIYVRQYQGSFTTLKRTATLLDASGNTSFPGTVTATGFSGPLTGNVTGNCSGSSGSCTGNAANVTGTVAIAHGGTGATSRLNAVKALTNEDVGINAQFFLTITTNWGKAGYCSVANAKTVLGVPTKTSQLTNDSGYLTSHQSLANYLTKTTNVSEMGRYIDLHYDNATSKYDYDVRLYADSQGTAAGGGSFKIAAASAYAPAPASNANDTRIATTAWVNSKGYLTSHQSLSNYSTLANTVKSLSISGKTITVTPGSGNAYTLTTQDTVYTHPTTAGNKHIPSGGRSDQILRYSSSGTAVWSDVSFTRKFDQVFNTAVTSSPTSILPHADTVSLTATQLALVTIDVTTDNTLLIKVTANNIFVIAIHTLVGTNAFKQDSVNYGSILQQTATGRSRLAALILPYNSSVTFTTAIQAGAGANNKLNSFSLTVYQ